METTEKKSGGIKILLIIISIVGVVAILAGILMYLLFFRQTKDDAIEVQDTETIGYVTQKTRTLSDLFLYPGSTMAEPSYNTPDGAKVLLQMNTIEEVATVSEHYVQLAALNGWELGSHGVSSDGSGGWLNIEQDDFSVTIHMSRAGRKTSVEVFIYYDTEELTSSVQRIPEYEPTTQEATPSERTEQESGETDFIFVDSNTKEISQEELIDLSEWELKVARNEIYARHGREFVHRDLACYFETKEWYEVNDSYSPSDLSVIENTNVALILAYEEEIGSSLLRVDSGCATE